jgi:hypothetical protein
MARKIKDRVEAEIEAGNERARQVASDRQIAQLRDSLADSQRKYKAALAELDAAHKRADLQASLIDMKPRQVKDKATKKGSPATAVLVLSDWHIEETVTPSTVNNLNEYSIPIARRRVQEVFSRAAMLLAHERQLVDIDHLVIAALGDFISGHIHEELLETCSMGPMEATREVGELLLGGIDKMLESFRRITVVTAHGNHGRSTPKIRVATGARHSHEYNLYKWLEKSTRGTRGLEWQIADGYLNYMDVQGYTIRFHHGDAVKYSAGVGGLTIPMNKAKSNWDRSRHSDLDICGHFHTWLYMPYKFLVNGCVIGMNPFALRIRAEYQPPSQSLLIVDGRHGVTKALQVFADRDVRRDQ